MEDKLKTAMDILDVVFLFMFVFEAMMKVIVRSFVAHESYLRSAWNVLDFIIVIVGLIAFGIEYSDGSSRDLMAGGLSVQGIETLRMASRAQGMKVVVNALFSAVPGITNVAFVCLLFYVIFGILGLNLFMGKMYYCADTDDLSTRLVPGGMGVKDADMTRKWCFRDDGAHFYCPPRTIPCTPAETRDERDGPTPRLGRLVDVRQDARLEWDSPPLGTRAWRERPAPGGRARRGRPRWPRTGRSASWRAGGGERRR